jgi:hypothetical protein
MAAIAEDPVVQHLVLAAQHRAGRAQRPDGAIGEADHHGIGQIDLELEGFRQSGDAHRLQPRQ